MDIILWRHAEAEDGTLTLPDDQRRLTERGVKQARKMAQWLDKRLPAATRILVSPAQRTQQTLHPLQRPCEVEPRISVGATANDLLTAAGWPDAHGTVLVVGHQPTLGQVAAQLLGARNTDLAIKKGAIWWFASRTRAGETQALLRAVLNAEVL